MHNDGGGRIEALKDLVRRVTKITTLLDTGGIKVRFMNYTGDSGYDDIRTMEDVERIMCCMEFNGRLSKIGTSMEVKILDPLVFQKTGKKRLNKPLLITTITDGEVWVPIIVGWMLLKIEIAEWRRPRSP